MQFIWYMKVRYLHIKIKKKKMLYLKVSEYDTQFVPNKYNYHLQIQIRHITNKSFISTPLTKRNNLS